MLGAVTGDIIGSVYEGKNIKNKNFNLFDPNCRFTDDSVMSIAISKACIQYKKDKDESNFKANCIKYMQKFGRKYINAGYGGTFIYWILSKNPKPYNSFGNGSAMRVSSVAWISKSLIETEKLAKLSAEVTHNHPYGIVGAKAVAGSTWILLNGGNKDDVKKYIERNYYKLDFKLDDIREQYEFDVTCQGSVPQAIESFLEAANYEDAIRNAISIGGDSDTIAAIAGSMAEAAFGVPKEIRDKALSFLDNDLKLELINFYNIVSREKDQSMNEKEER